MASTLTNTLATELAVLTAETRNDLAERQKITEPLLGLFGAEAFARGLTQSKWNAAEETAILIDMARDDELDPRERRAAMKMLRQNGMEAMILEGLVRKGTAHASSEKDGVRITEDINVVRMMPKLQAEPLQETPSVQKQLPPDIEATIISSVRDELGEPALIGPADEGRSGADSAECGQHQDVDEAIPPCLGIAGLDEPPVPNHGGD